jgi:acyl carrier protein
MDTDAIRTRVHDTIREVLRVPQSALGDNSRFREDLGADSLDLVTLIMALEEEFGGAISKEEEQQLVTIGAVIALIESRMAASVAQ